jgi:predicted phosphodiesterase
MSAKPIMVLSSDWHLSPQSWKKHPRIVKDSYYSLSQIVDIALSLNVPLIGAGDLFDVKTPPSESVLACYKEMSRLEKANLPVYYVQGQHEFSDDPWMGLCKNAVDIDSFKKNSDDPEIFEINGISICGMDICQSPLNFGIKLGKLIEKANNSRFDLFVTHQVWGDFIKKSEEPYLLKNATFANMVYTGDFHKDLILDIDGVTCVSSGSIAMQANNENPNKRVFILNDDMSLSSYWLKTRPFVSLEIKTEKDFEFVMDSEKEALLTGWWYLNDLPEYISTPLIVVKYQNTISNAFFALKDKFKEWNNEINPVDFSSAEITAAVERREIRDLVDIGDCISKCVPPNGITYSDAIRVFNSSDVETEIKSMREEHLKKGVSNVS